MCNKLARRQVLLSAWLLLILIGIVLVLSPLPVAAQGHPDARPPRPGAGAPSLTGSPGALRPPAPETGMGVAPSPAERKALDAATRTQPTVRAQYPARDRFGYRASVVPYNWVDISISGTKIITWTGSGEDTLDDGYAGPFPIGFQFPFYDQAWDEVYVSNNGLLSFGAGTEEYGNSCPLPAAGAPDNLIALLWDDLNLNNSGEVYYQSFPVCPAGVGQCLVVAYHNMAFRGGAAGSAGTWEAILYADGATVVQFQDVGAAAGEHSTTGIENADAAADFGLTYACDTPASLANELAVRFELRPILTLSPLLLETKGCNAAPQQHQLEAQNRTGMTGTFPLAYAATPGVAVQGPPSVQLGDGERKPITVTMTPNVCPAPADPITATVTITGDGVGSSSVIAKEIVEGYTWQEIPPEPDDGRMDNVLAAYGGKLWSITGYYDTVGTADVRTFDPLTQAWATIADSAPPFGENYAHSGCQHGGKVFVYGDASASAIEDGFTGLWSYNMATNTWQRETPSGMAPDRSGIWMPAWVKDSETNRCYLTGGATEPGPGDLNTTYVYDPAANAWLAPLPNFTTARDFHAAFVFRQPEDNKKLLCVIGGLHATSPEATPLTSTQCYDLAAGPANWNAENADMPALDGLPWWGMGYTMRMGADAPELWLVGGHRLNIKWPFTEYYDPLQGAWVFGGRLATAAAYRTAAVTLNNVVYQVGGDIGDWDNTGNANVLGECPYCAGIRLEPQFTRVESCNNVTENHRFSLWNDTAAPATVGLAYAATPGVTVNGPASVNPGAGERAVFTMALTPAFCPEADLEITATVAAAGAGFQADAALEEWVNSLTTWEPIASESNAGRYDHVLAAYDGKVWAIGGADDVTGDLPVRTYNPATGAWADVRNSVSPWGDGQPRSGCQVGSRVYMYGDEVAYHGLVYYDMATNQWQQVTGAANPPAVADSWAPAWVYDPDAGLCYLTGGSVAEEAGKGNQATVYAYNPTTNAWSRLPDFTTARNLHAAFVTHRPTDNHKLLCIAGGRNAGSGELASTQCYDFALSAWNPENADLGELPATWSAMGYTQRSAGAMPQLWIIAGTKSEDATDQTLVFDFLRGKWQYSNWLATGSTDYTAATTLDDVIYQSGGLVYDWEADKVVPTGLANRSVDCPACEGIFLVPERIDAESCSTLPQTHTFELWNLTGATGNFTMTYGGGPQAAATGPTSLTTNHGTVTPVHVTLTPLFCPAPGAQLAATIAAAGNAYNDTAALLETIVAQTTTWIYRTAAPATQYDAAGAVLNNKLYAAGGRIGEPAQDYTGCSVYDPTADSWASCPSLTAGRYHAEGASDGQAVYVIGGRDSSDAIVADMFALVGDEWQPRAPAPVARAGAAAVGAAGVIYYSGGFDQALRAYASFWLYTAATNTWAALPDLPAATSGHAMALLNGRIYVFPSMSPDVWIYDIGGATWRVVTPAHPASAIWGYLAVVDGSRILRLGGRAQYSGMGQADVWAFDPVTEDFVELKPLRQARGAAVGGVLNGEPHIGLGVTGEWITPEPLASLEHLASCPQCGAPSLAIVKTGPVTATVGVPFTYTLTVTNTGAGPTANLLVTDTLPAGTTHVSGGALVGSQVRFSIASLAIGAHEVMSFAVAANAAATVVNSAFAVTAPGGIHAEGSQAVTTVVGSNRYSTYMPLVAR